MKILDLQIFSQKMVENLISDLLDLAKLDNSQFKINFSYFNFLDTVYGALEVMKDNAALRKIQLRATVSSRDHLEFLKNIQGDHNRYMQIFLNFLSNSIKFTPDGGQVEIEVKIKSIQNLISHSRRKDIEKKINSKVKNIEDLEKF